MATFLTERPFRGVRQTKYLQLLETTPEWVKKVSNEELEEYLYALEKRYQSRCSQLVSDGVAKALAENPQMSGTAQHTMLVEELAVQAREIAMQELLSA